MTSDPKRNELLGAIARGWCHSKTSHKVIDPDLAFAIADEVLALFAIPTARRPAPPPVDNAFVAVGSTRFGDGQIQTEESLAAAQVQYQWARFEVWAKSQGLGGSLDIMTWEWRAWQAALQK